MSSIAMPAKKCGLVINAIRKPVIDKSRPDVFEADFVKPSLPVCSMPPRPRK